MRRSGLAFGGLCAVTTALVPCAGLAQDAGVRMVFGIENRLEVVRNDSLSVPAEGTDVVNATRLSFGLSSVTELDRLDFSVAGAAIIENDSDDSGAEFDFGRFAVDLNYRREIPAAVLEVIGQIRRDDPGALVDDLTLEDTDGTRTDYLLSTRLEVGRTSAVGFALGLAYDVTEFEDVTDPDLVDETEVRADTAVIFRFSEVATGRVGVRFSRLEEETPGSTVTDTLTSFVGLDYALSQRLDLTAELGYTEVETTDFGVTERTTGPAVSLGLTYDMPVGTASASLRIETDSDIGRRETFEIGRAFETPRDTISARVGVTRSDPTGTDVIGSLSWDHTLPDGGIGLDLERRVSFDTDDDEEVSTATASLNWIKTISDLNSISLDLTYERSESASENIEQVTLGAEYSRRLTEDWTLSSGVNYRVRHDADGRAESPGVFLSLSREFVFRP